MKLELKHLAPYLPYGLKVHYSGLTDDDVSGEFTVIAYHVGNGVSLIDDGALEEGDLSESFYVDYDFPIKPILRPLSSMTKEEAYEFGVLLMGEADMEDKEVGVGCITLMGDTYPVIMYQDQEDEEYSVMVQFASTGMSVSVIDLIPYAAYEWLFKNHFDVFGLIDKGLAIEKTL